VEVEGLVPEGALEVLLTTMKEEEGGETGVLEEEEEATLIMALEGGGIMVLTGEEGPGVEVEEALNREDLDLSVAEVPDLQVKVLHLMYMTVRRDLCLITHT